MTIMLTRELACRASALSSATLPADILERASQCMLDWAGVALAAQGEPLVSILHNALALEGGTGDASLVGRAGRYPASRAAFFNGAAGHALDYDDVSLVGHPTAPLAPVVLALGEKLGKGGADIVAAFVAGYETQTRIALFMGPSHYASGWHSTATFGAFGAAAAAANLLGLDELRTRHALGLAGTQAAGLKAVFGSMAKPLHAGHAAEVGLRAALFAAAGFTSSPDILEAPQGFGATQSNETSVDAALADPPDGFHLRGNLFKYHAACYLTHSTIEALRELGEKGLDARDVAEIELSVSPTHLGVCNIAAPTDGLQAKFSLRQIAAMVLAGIDTANPASFNDRVARRADLARLRGLVFVKASSEGTSARVTVRRTDGSKLSATRDVAVPEQNLAVQRIRLEAKFRAIVDPSFDVDAIIGALSQFAGLDTVRPLMALLGRAVTPTGVTARPASD